MRVGHYAAFEDQMDQKSFQCNVPPQTTRVVRATSKEKPYQKGSWGIDAKVSPNGACWHSHYLQRLRWKVHFYAFRTFSVSEIVCFHPHSSEHLRFLFLPMRWIYVLNPPEKVVFLGSVGKFDVSW